MMNKLVRYLGGAVLASALALAVPAWSMGPQGGPPGGDGGHFFGRLVQDLDLSPEQREQIRGLLQASREASQADHDRLRGLREQLKDQRLAFDEAKARAMADEIGAITARLTYSMASTSAQVYALLTPEQRSQLDAKLQDMEQHMQRHRPPAGGQ